MFCMSEQEKYVQVGRLAEEYGHIKGKLSHVQEKLNRAGIAYTTVTQNFPNLTVVAGRLHKPNSPYPSSQDALDHLLSSSELVDVLEEKNRLSKELSQAADRLKAVAPHLL